MLKSPINRYYEHASIFMLGLLCLYVAAFYLQLGKRIDILGAIRFDFLLGIVLSTLGIIQLSKLRRPKSPLFNYVLCFYLIMVLMVIFSRNVAVSWEMFFNRVFKYSLLTLFVAAFVRSPRDLFCFIGIFLLACFKLGQEGLLGYLTGSLMWENQGVMRLHGSTPMYKHPNSFSGMALGTLPFIYFLFPSSGKYIKLFLLALLVFAINIILFTGSRTAYVGFLGLAGYLLMKSKHRARAIVFGLIAVIVAIPFVPDQYVQRFESIFTGEEAEGDSSGKRLEILEDAVEIWLTYPLGTGIYGFRQARIEMFGRFQDTHNLYFEVLTNIGIQGLVVFLLLIYKLMKHLRLTSEDFQRHASALQSINQHALGGELQDKISAQIRQLLFCGAVANAIRGFIVMRLVIGLFGMDLYEIYWWFALGTYIALFNIEKQAATVNQQLLEEAGVASSTADHQQTSAASATNPR